MGYAVMKIWGSVSIYSFLSFSFFPIMRSVLLLLLTGAAVVLGAEEVEHDYEVESVEEEEEPELPTVKTTLETSGEDGNFTRTGWGRWKLHSQQVEKI
jgi:hypothetical protein